MQPAKTAKATTLVTLLSMSLTKVAPVMAQTKCPTDSVQIAQSIAEAWRSKEAVSVLKVADARDAQCVQTALVEALRPTAGTSIGWKIGLTSKTVQSNFDIDRPLAGQLLSDMLLEDEAMVPQDYGARPIAEADLLATVGSTAIMDADTPLEALSAIKSFAPFIELADLMVVSGEPLTGEVITAINVGARLGVVGPSFSLDASDTTVQALTDMQVEIIARGGDTITVPGSAILGNPLNAVLWLIDELKGQGESLAPGDLVSLGSFGPPIPTKDLSRFEVTYMGLPIETVPKVSVNFE